MIRSADDRDSAPGCLPARLARTARGALLALLTATLAACGGGGGDDGDDGSNPPPGDTVTISGRVTFERVPFSTNTDRGLDYAAIVAAPAREIVVEVLNSSSQAVLASTTTNTNGQYSATVPSNTSVIVRAKAQTRHAAPGWDVQVLNNANGNALYVLDSAAFTTDTAAITRNLLADSGWPDFGGTNYSGTRASAPFAILDTIYAAVQFLRTNGGSDLDLPPLKAYWSKDNRSSNTWDPSTGAILSGTQYTSGPIDGFPAGMYVLGQEGVDTDEFDQHVIAHEFQHYLEDAISRGDSPGGSHSIHDRLDLRLAFSEGYGNAFSGMVLDDPVYRDSFGTSQGDSFLLNMEGNTNTPAGWYNEASVYSLVWDLYDTASDGPDAVALGFAPMLGALRNELRDGAPLQSIYAFAAALRADAGAPTAAIDALLASQQIFGSGPYATGETNDGSGLIPEALPIYNEVAVGGTTRVCGSIKAGTYNKAGNRVFLRFSLASARSTTIRAEYTATGSAPGGPTPDPDIVLWHGGFLDSAETEAPNVETWTGSLQAGDYVVEVYDYSHVNLASGVTRRGVTCMNVSIS